MDENMEKWLESRVGETANEIKSALEDKNEYLLRNLRRQLKLNEKQVYEVQLNCIQRLETYLFENTGTKLRESEEVIFKKIKDNMKS